MPPFRSSHDHLIAQFSLLDLLLKRRIYKMRSNIIKKNEYAGLVISEEEIDELIKSDVSDKLSETDGNQEFFIDLDNQIEQVRLNLKQSEEDSLQNGIDLTLCNLQKRFHLDMVHREILIIALAQEISSKYEKIYAYIQNDITRKLPTIELILSLLDVNYSEPNLGYDPFYMESPLISFDLIQILTEPSRPYTPFPAKYIKVDDRILRFLLCNNSVDDNISYYAQITAPYLDIDSLAPEQQTLYTIETITHSDHYSNSLITYLEGPLGADKYGFAEVICTLWKRQLLTVIEDPFIDKTNSTHFIKCLFREALLSNAAIFLAPWIQKYLEASSRIIQQIISMAENAAVPVFISGEQPWEPGCMVKGAKFFRLLITHPSSEAQFALWKRAFNGHILKDADKVLGNVQSVFRLNRVQISDAALTAIRLSKRKSPESIGLDYNDVYTACRIHSFSRMGNLARKVTPKHVWDDIVLPKEKILHLKELCDCVQYRSVVFGKWGFDSKLSLGKGISALFAGTSGTGKTMAAEIIANTLQAELLKIDLSSVVSKYIGETEKNLSLIFDEAENNNVILFFDEADALLGKRSEVKDAHDRYSNIETAYLLQRMEEYSGISLLATNLRQNIDNAFVRRIRFIIEFPFPDTLLRKNIWKKIWAPGVPLSDDLDFDFLAHQFELSGGNIRNVAVNSAFLAAEQDTVVSMVHILRAVKRELQKMGKVCLDQDFGKYQNLTISIDKTGVEE